MTNNFCFKPESRVNWAHGIRKWYWNYPKTSQGGAKESKIWVLRVDFDNDKSSSKNILSNWIFLTIFLSTTKTPESAKKNYQNISILDQISISKKNPNLFVTFPDSCDIQKLQLLIQRDLRKFLQHKF